MPAHTMSAASVATSTSTGLALPQSGARKPVRVLYGTASWPWPWPCPCSVAAGVGMYPVLNTTACGPSLSWRTSSWPGGGPGSASATRPRGGLQLTLPAEVEWPGVRVRSSRRGFYRVIAIDLLRPRARFGALQPGNIDTRRISGIFPTAVRFYEYGMSPASCALARGRRDVATARARDRSPRTWRL